MHALDKVIAGSWKLEIRSALRNTPRWDINDLPEDENKQSFKTTYADCIIQEKMNASMKRHPQFGNGETANGLEPGN